MRIAVKIGTSNLTHATGRINIRQIISKVVTLEELPAAVRDLDEHPGRGQVLSGLLPGLRSGALRRAAEAHGAPEHPEGEEPLLRHDGQAEGGGDPGPPGEGLAAGRALQRHRPHRPGRHRPEHPGGRRGGPDHRPVQPPGGGDGGPGGLGRVHPQRRAGGGLRAGGDANPGSSRSSPWASRPCWSSCLREGSSPGTRTSS